MCIILYASGRQMFAVSYDIKFILKKGFDVIKNLVQIVIFCHQHGRKTLPKGLVMRVLTRHALLYSFFRGGLYCNVNKSSSDAP